MAYTYSHNDQPGLEVVHPDTGLQVSYPPQEWMYSTGAGQEQKEVVSQAGAGVKIEEGNAPPRKRINKKILLIALACIVIIIGVVVGAVVGTRSSRSSEPVSSPTATIPPPSPPAPGQGNGTSISSPAEMTASPTSVSPGLAPTPISWGYPHLEIFALTANTTDSVYRKYRNVNATDNKWYPGGYEMELVGGSVSADSSPSVAVNHRISHLTANQTELYINGNGAGWRKWHEIDPTWTPSDTNAWYGFFEDLDGVIGSFALAKYEPALELVKVFCLAAGDKGLAVYFTQWYPQVDWSRAIQIPGPDLQPMTPAVVAWSGNDSRLDVFAVSRSNSHLLHAWWEAERAAWSDYEDLGGFATTPPVAVSRSPGVLDVFVRGGDAGLWHLSYEGSSQSWTGWTRISGDMKIQGQPEAIAATSDTVDVFAWREDGCLVYKSFDSASNVWTPEHDFEVLADASEGQFTGPPRAVSDGPGSIHVFAYRNENELVWMSLSSGSVGQTADTSTLANVPYM